MEPAPASARLPLSHLSLRTCQVVLGFASSKSRLPAFLPLAPNERGSLGVMDTDSLRGAGRG